MKKDLNWAVLGTGVIAKVYDSIDEVFVDDEVDIIYITTPHNTHYEFMKAGRGCEPEKGITNWFRRAGNHLIKNDSDQMATVALSMHSKQPKRAMISCEKVFL